MRNDNLVENKMITITIAQLLNTCEQVLSDLQSLIVKSRPPTGGRDRPRTALLLTLAEQFEATLLLAKGQLITHAATHVRSMIEGLVIMKLLESDGSHVEQMRYEQLRGELRVYKGILDDPDIPEDMKAPIRERQDPCKRTCDSFREAGRKPTKISECFGAAKLLNLVAPYSMLCAFSHNDLAVLALRHQSEKSMIYKQEDSPDVVRSVISTALLVLMEATDQFGRIAQFPDHHFDSVFAAMHQKWTSVFDESVQG